MRSRCIGGFVSAIPLDRIPSRFARERWPPPGLPRTPMPRRHGMPRDGRMRASRASRPVPEHHPPPQKRSIRADKVGLFLRFSHSASSILRSFAVALFLRIGLSAECYARSFAKRSGPPLAMLAVALFLRIGLSAECHARSFAKRSGPPLAMLAVALFLRFLTSSASLSPRRRSLGAIVVPLAARQSCQAGGGAWANPTDLTFLKHLFSKGLDSPE